MQYDYLRGEQDKGGDMKRDHNIWTTGHEIKFLDSMGNFGPKPRSHQELLKKYIKAMGQRWNWAGMNAGEIERHAKNLLASY